MPKCADLPLTATLLALADACNYSLSKHVLEEAVIKRISPEFKMDDRKCLKELVRSGLCQKHPTRGSSTYELTRSGLDMALKITGK